MCGQWIPGTPLPFIKCMGMSDCDLEKEICTVKLSFRMDLDNDTPGKVPCMFHCYFHGTLPMNISKKLYFPWGMKRPEKLETHEIPMKVCNV